MAILNSVGGGNERLKEGDLGLVSLSFQLNQKKKKGEGGAKTGFQLGVSGDC